MGYFSNSTEGEMYQDKWCRRCVHYGPEEGPGCPIWGLHLAYNYDQLREGKQDLKVVLESLIPREGIHNGQCKMFLEVTHG